MNTVLGVVIWFVQLIYLILLAVGKTIMQLFTNVTGATQTHLNHNAERGKIFVKAYYFLEVLEDEGETPERANRIASTLFDAWSDPEIDNRIIRRATTYAKENHGGNQLPIIQQARAKGFAG
ncbi:hypothetical protein [uncultured Roseovarius sp.]|uniref:hypothetical protein n=1 Tax=uncultured Roseovarius sp. TaxID=293344 RepID=UPI000C61E76C|nr:hypothetical protein [Roseovarius sp.]MBD11141.1 hypothetical protein [Roseovarius sp.]|tara:strand:- start:23 stop:388 length:366 start_codon:yes stop_codon:yes gene_type:complete